MIYYPAFNRIALQIGAIKIYWYGAFYLFSFFVAWWLAKIRAKHLSYSWSNIFIMDLIVYGAIGVVVGGRLGYTLFYDFPAILADPLLMFKVWQGGMSFHGGLLGVITAIFLFARNHQLSVMALLDFVAPLVPIGLFFGRIGNFINSELWGRATNLPWGMIFPNGDLVIRHPSQLYEALGEGIILFFILWIYAAKPRTPGNTSALFLCYYGIIRFFCEFFREPDPQYGFIAFGWLTIGQLFSCLMITAGLLLFWLQLVQKKHKKIQAP